MTSRVTKPDQALVRAPANDRLDRVYRNEGNLAILDLLDVDDARILDVGCGAGNNAAIIATRYEHSSLFGVTRSASEAKQASRHMTRCWTFDLERDALPSDLAATQFDVLLFSHVLEHLANPANVLALLLKLLRVGGRVLIAVPNVMFWRMRLRFATGRFEYESSGVLDNTHLRFFTFFTADRYLLALCPELRVTFKGVSGSVPLWYLRRYVLSAEVSQRLDRFGCHFWPNVFGSQVLIRAVKLAYSSADTCSRQAASRTLPYSHTR